MRRGGVASGDEMMVLTTLLTMLIQAAVPAHSSAVHRAGHHARSNSAAHSKAWRGAQFINMDEVFNVGSYPFWASRNNVEGHVRFRVAIDARGRPTSCRVVKAARSYWLNFGTCDLMLNVARFTPGIDSAGRPAAAAYERVVRWQLEDRDPLPVTDEYQRVVISFDAGGEQHCRAEKSAGAEMDPRSCDYLATEQPVGLFASIRALIGADRTASQWDVVIEESQFAGAGDASATVGSRPGELPFSRFRKRLTIDPSGKVIACETIELGWASEAGAKQNCEDSATFMYAPAAADGGNRTLTDVGAEYFRKR